MEKTLKKWKLRKFFKQESNCSLKVLLNMIIKVYNIL